MFLNALIGTRMTRIKNADYQTVQTGHALSLRIPTSQLIITLTPYHIVLLYISIICFTLFCQL